MCAKVVDICGYGLNDYTKCFDMVCLFSAMSTESIQSYIWLMFSSWKISKLITTMNFIDVCGKLEKNEIRCIALQRTEDVFISKSINSNQFSLLCFVLIEWKVERIECSSKFDRWVDLSCFFFNWCFFVCISTAIQCIHNK